MTQLVNRYQLHPLNYTLDIRDCIGLVGHRDVLKDPSFSEMYLQAVSCLRAGISVSSSQIKWLS